VKLSSHDSWYKSLLIWEIMASSMTDPKSQQGGKKGKEKTKNITVLVEDRLRKEVQTAMNSAVSTINMEIQALQASEATKDGEL